MSQPAFTVEAVNDTHPAAGGGYQIRVMLDDPSDITAVEAAAVLLGAGPVTVDSTGPLPVAQLTLMAPDDDSALQAAAAAACVLSRHPRPTELVP